MLHNNNKVNNLIELISLDIGLFEKTLSTLKPEVLKSVVNEVAFLRDSKGNLYLEKMIAYPTLLKKTLNSLDHNELYLALHQHNKAGETFAMMMIRKKLTKLLLESNLDNKTLDGLIRENPKFSLEFFSQDKNIFPIVNEMYNSHWKDNPKAINQVLENAPQIIKFLLANTGYDIIKNFIEHGKESLLQHSVLIKGHPSLFIKQPQGYIELIELLFKKNPLLVSPFIHKFLYSGFSLWYKLSEFILEKDNPNELATIIKYLNEIIPPDATSIPKSQEWLDLLQKRLEKLKKNGFETSQDYLALLSIKARVQLIHEKENCVISHYKTYLQVAEINDLSDEQHSLYINKLEEALAFQTSTDQEKDEIDFRILQHKINIKEEKSDDSFNQSLQQKSQAWNKRAKETYQKAIQVLEQSLINTDVYTPRQIRQRKNLLTALNVATTLKLQSEVIGTLLPQLEKNNHPSDRLWLDPLKESMHAFLILSKEQPSVIERFEAVANLNLNDLKQLILTDLKLFANLLNDLSDEKLNDLLSKDTPPSLILHFYNNKPYLINEIHARISEETLLKAINIPSTGDRLVIDDICVNKYFFDKILQKIKDTNALSNIMRQPDKNNNKTLDRIGNLLSVVHLRDHLNYYSAGEINEFFVKNPDLFSISLLEGNPAFLQKAISEGNYNICNLAAATKTKKGLSLLTYGLKKYEEENVISNQAGDFIQKAGSLWGFSHKDPYILLPVITLILKHTNNEKILDSLLLAKKGKNVLLVNLINRFTYQSHLEFKEGLVHAIANMSPAGLNKALENTPELLTFMRDYPDELAKLIGKADDKALFNNIVKNFKKKQLYISINCWDLFIEKNPFIFAKFYFEKNFNYPNANQHREAGKFFLKNGKIKLNESMLNFLKTNFSNSNKITHHKEWLKVLKNAMSYADEKTKNLLLHYMANIYFSPTYPDKSKNPIHLVGSVILQISNPLDIPKDKLETWADCLRHYIATAKLPPKEKQKADFLFLEYLAACHPEGESKDSAVLSNAILSLDDENQELKSESKFDKNKFYKKIDDIEKSLSDKIDKQMNEMKKYLAIREKETNKYYMFGYSKKDYELRNTIYNILNNQDMPLTDKKSFIEAALKNKKLTHGMRHKAADILKNMLNDINTLIEFQSRFPKDKAPGFRKD